MNPVRRGLVWLSRLHRCWGFGIQSPSDYSFVRNVVNEHWPYYAYEQLAAGDWLTRKLGWLYLRLANWRQPSAMLADEWQRYWHAGCRHTCFTEHLDRLELGRVDIDDQEGFEGLAAKSDADSVLVVERLWHNWQRWHAIERDPRVGTTFDLYYCGIVLFDKQRASHHYKVNF